MDSVDHWNEITDFMVSSPTFLLDNKIGLMTPEEQAEMDEIGRMSHVVTMLKATAHLKIREHEQSG